MLPKSVLKENLQETLFWTKLLLRPRQSRLKTKMESLMLKFYVTKLKLSCLSPLLRNQD